MFTSAEAVNWAKAGKQVILVREETNPEDVEGMRAAEGILTARGGMTSHAALVARGWGKCCIVGAGALKINMATRTLNVDGKSLKEGDVITLNGTRGLAYEGALAMMDATENPRFQEFMKIVDRHRKLGVRTNADTPSDARVARSFGAEGIGLFRTEHMFYGTGSDQAAVPAAEDDPQQHRGRAPQAARELFPFVKRDIKATLEAMDGLPVTIRLLDPPLHEFVPQHPEAQAELAKSLGISVEEVKKRGEALHENNPMMGHRGVRLGITYPEVTEMQVRAIFEAAAELIKAGKNAKPEIMVPVTCDVGEIDITKVIVDRLHEEVKKATGIDVHYLYGTMIEIPRACLLADRMAKSSQFFSFGTNDLTQMTFGFSRDDIGGFVPDYLKLDILKADPFQTIDQEGVGQLIQMAVEQGASHPVGPEDRDLRRAGRRPGLGRVLLQERAELRELLPVPRADRPVGGGPGHGEGREEVSRRSSGRFDAEPMRGRWLRLPPPFFWRRERERPKGKAEGEPSENPRPQRHAKHGRGIGWRGTSRLRAVGMARSRATCQHPSPPAPLPRAREGVLARPGPRRRAGEASVERL